MSTFQNCSACKKGAGLYICAGCHAYFCTKDLKVHREQLDSEIIGLIGDRNDLQNRMNEINQEENSGHILRQIDEWQRTTINKVEQVAEQARQQVIRLLNSQQTDMINQFEIMSQELVQRKQSEEYLEQNIESIRKNIKRLNQDLKLLKEQNTVKLNIEHSNTIAWDRMIYVEEKALHTTNQERQQTETGKHQLIATPAREERKTSINLQSISSLL